MKAPRQTASWILSVVIFSTVLLATSCATNPVTGQRELMLVSEQQEAEMGKRANEETIEEFGIYAEKPALLAEVRRVGGALAAASDRPDVKWSFTILDTSMVNAMALPGGYVYITRGMLERINSSDELAGVLGHEIAHVTARHAAQRMSRAQLAQLGLVIGAVAAGPDAVQRWGDLAQIGASLLFQTYSRSQESQADLIGTGYASRAGFNPIGAERMLTTLRRLQPEGSGGGFERYFQSHPDPAKRVGDVKAKIAEIETADPSVVKRPIERDPFVRGLDGMITGLGTSRVTIRDNTVYEKGWGIVLPYPEGWKASAGLGGLFDIQSQTIENARLSFSEVRLDRLDGKSPRDALRSRLEEAGAKYVSTTRAKARSGEEFTIDIWAAKTESATLAVEMTTRTDDNKALVIIEVSPRAVYGQSALTNTIEALAVDKRKAGAVEPPRLSLRRAAASDTWAALAKRATGREADAKEIASINGFNLDATAFAGLLVKLPAQIVDR